jgi:hypothetical protein
MIARAGVAEVSALMKVTSTYLASSVAAIAADFFLTRLTITQLYSRLPLQTPPGRRHESCPSRA